MSRVLTHREIIPRRLDCLAGGPGFEPAPFRVFRRLYPNKSAPSSSTFRGVRAGRPDRGQAHIGRSARSERAAVFGQHLPARLDKDFRLTRILEPLHLAFSSPDRLTRVLDLIVASSAALVAGRDPEILGPRRYRTATMSNWVASADTAAMCGPVAVSIPSDGERMKAISSTYIRP